MSLKLLLKFINGSANREYNDALKKRSEYLNDWSKKVIIGIEKANKLHELIKTLDHEGEIHPQAHIENSSASEEKIKLLKEKALYDTN